MNRLERAVLLIAVTLWAIAAEIAGLAVGADPALLIAPLGFAAGLILRELYRAATTPDTSYRMIDTRFSDGGTDHK